LKPPTSYAPGSLNNQILNGFLVNQPVPE